jgi:hypothetical protein
MSSSMATSAIPSLANTIASTSTPASSMPTSPGDATPIDGEKVEIKGELGGDGVKAEDVKEEVKQDLEEAGVDNPQVCVKRYFNGDHCHPPSSFTYRMKEVQSDG